MLTGCRECTNHEIQHFWTTFLEKGPEGLNKRADAYILA